MGTETVVWVVTEYHNCTGDDVVELDGSPVVAICASEQLARQIEKTNSNVYGVRRFVVGTNRQSAMFW